MQKMQSKKQFLMVFLTLIILSISCEKEELIEPLPPNTEIGANTFIFRVNGGEIIESEVGYIPAMPRLHVFFNHVDTIYGNYILV